MGGQDRVALADRERPLDDQGLARAVLLDDAGLLERLDEGPARTVAARGLGGVDLDQAVVDPRARQRGHHVLDHLDLGRPALDRRPSLATERHGRSGRARWADPGGRNERKPRRCRVRRG